MNNKPNLDAARAAYGNPDYKYGTQYLSWPGHPLDYSHAYVVSNENLRHTTGLTRDMGRRVLTVAGSGEQPLFYTINGATQIDTFDISYCARAIMDIKTQAIRSGMPYEQYKKLLKDLHFAPSASKVSGVSEILPKIPAHSAQFVRGMDGYRIFGNGLNPEYYASEMISETEYKTLQKALRGAFKFIWSDVATLHTQLNGEYDVINLSNIFEWSPDLIQPTLTNLRNYVRPGGYILVQTGCGMAIGKNMDKFIDVQDALKDWAKIGINKQERDTQVIILERTR
ncbi:MAG: class I SAM-dependent methyltransferase [Alphaproteobacteria bacterium]|nr:class I SAM-dependent methyltransferase [Alphaproteobacteria bacterium]